MAQQKNSTDILRQEYKRGAKRKLLIILCGGIFIILLSLLFVNFGATNTRMLDVFNAIGNVFSKGGELSDQDQIIIQLRLPRIVMAIFAGFGLSLSGVSMQGITRNPLVSPFTIGISNAAAFGASIAIVFGVSVLPGTDLGIVLNAFLLALLCTALVYLVSTKAGMSPESIVLTGIALNYLFSAATSTIEYFADEHDLAAVVQWAFGSFNGAQWEEVGIMGAVVLTCGIVIYCFVPSLNVMSSGDDEVARSLGVHPGRVRLIIGIVSVLSTAAVISFTGVIGFVGLAGPHIARMAIGNDHRYLVPFSAVTGALLLLVADTIGKHLLSPVIIPVGIVVSFLGVPIFINLLLTKRKGYFK